MKEARFLIRLSNEAGHQPFEQGSLLIKARSLAAPLKGKVINLRVTPTALEFDLFCAPETSIDPFFKTWESLGQKLTCKRLDVPPPPIEAQAIVTEARQLFNEHRFWEVHEVLEGLWKVRHGSEKQLIQGLILTAAALVHWQKNEAKVVWPMLEDAMRRLENQPADYFGWPIAALRKHFLDAVRRREISDLSV